MPADCGRPQLICTDVRRDEFGDDPKTRRPPQTTGPGASRGSRAGAEDQSFFELFPKDHATEKLCTVVSTEGPLFFPKYRP